MKKVLYTLISFLILIQVVSAQNIYTVTKTTDPDPYVYLFNDVDSLCDPVMYGTLQWAVRKSNNSNGDCIINFNIQGTGVHTIFLKYYLPQMQGNNIIIDGTSQVGYSKYLPSIIIDGTLKVKECFNIIKSQNIEIKGLYFKNFIYTGIFATNVSNLKINDCIINIAYSGSSEQTAISCQNCNIGEIYGNIIGGDIYNDSTGIIDNGILISNKSKNFIIGDTINDKKNIIKNCNLGIYILQSFQNKISGNAIYNNSTKGIELVEGNSNKIQPVLLALDSATNTLTGTAQPNDQIELFGCTGPENANNYFSTTQADANGNWQTVVNSSSPYLIATATDANGNTSEFSNVINGINCCVGEFYIIEPKSGDTLYFSAGDSLSAVVDPNMVFTYCSNQEICIYAKDAENCCVNHYYDCTFDGCYTDGLYYIDSSFCFTPNQGTIGFHHIEILYGACCQFRFNINIVQSPDPTIFTSQNPICQGESVDLMVQQPNPPLGFTYNWSNGVTTPNNDNLTPSTNTWYYVTVSNQGCEAYDSVQIIVNQNPVIDSLISTETCINPSCSGTATVYATGGAPYTYQWDNNAGGQTSQTASNLCQGIYTVTVTDNYTCTVTGNVSVDTLQAFHLNIIPQNTSCNFACDGQAIIGLIAPGGLFPNYHFSLSNGMSANGGLSATFTGLCSGNYSVTVTDGNGCEAYGNFNISNNNTMPSIPYFTVDTTNCLVTNDSISFSIINYNSTNTYVWNFGDTTFLTTNSQTVSHVYAEHGYHCVSVTANNPCGQSMIAATKVIYISKDICCNGVTYDFPHGTTISGNVIWDNVNYFINGDVIVEPNASLTIDSNSVIRFSEKSRIIVKAKGKLTVNNYSILTSIDPDFCMWQGIEVWGNTNQSSTQNNQGYLSVNYNSVIENAYVGVMVGARNLNVICPYALHNKYYINKSGGLLHVAHANFVNNGKDIVYVERSSQSKYLGYYDYIIYSSFHSSLMRDNFYNISNSIHYPNSLNSWAGSANNLQRGDIGIETDEVANLTIRKCNFNNKEFGVKSSDANLNIFSSYFTDLTEGIFIQNTYSSVNNFNKIQVDTFNLIPNYQTALDRGHMIHLENCKNDEIFKNVFGRNGQNNFDKNGVGIYIKNSSGFRVGDYNRYTYLNYGIIARNSGNIGGWIGPKNGEDNANNFKNVKFAVLTQFSNPKLTIRCNHFNPNNSTLYYSGKNIYSTGTLADQGDNPLNYSFINRTRALAGNKFLNSHHKEIACYSFCPGYDYWAHFEQEYLPVSLSTNIHVYHTNVHFNYPDSSCKDLVIISPQLKNYKNVSDSLLGVIHQKEVERNNLIASLDNGQTQYLLNLINANTNPFTLLIELNNNSPLSDTVLISLLTRHKNIPLPFLTVILASNTPVTKKVEPYFYNKVNSIHGYFKNVLLSLQGNNPIVTTVRDYNRIINNLDMWRKNIINKAVITYLDSANYNKDSAIAYIARENDFAYQQILFNSYLQDSLLTNAHIIFDNMQANNSDDIEWKTLNTLLLNLKDSGKTVLDLDSANIEYIRELAYNCEGGIATSQARALWKKLTGVTLVCGVDLPPEEKSMIVNNNVDDNLDNEIIESSNLVLGENYPDPCNEQTTIPYLLPQGFTGIINIHNIKGEDIGTYTLNPNNKELNIDTKNLKSGVYIYNMYLNNIIVGTGKIVVTH